MYSFSGLKVNSYFSGSATLTNQAVPLSNSICVYNDGASDLVLTVGALSITIKPGDLPFDECFEPFTKFTLTATTAFRVYTRG